MGAPPGICSLALAMAYMGPTYMTSSLEEARARGVILPDLSRMPVRPSENTEVTYPITNVRDAEAGEALNQIFAGAKDWIDLFDVPHKEFDPDDSARFQFVENLVAENQGMRRIYHALDMSNWNPATVGG